MKNIIITTFALLFLGVGQVQAQKSDKGLQKKILASKAKWETLKKEYKNCYTYVTSATSGLGGFTVRTYVTVKKGKVAKAYRITQYTNKKSAREEKKKKLSKQERSKLKNLDEIYAFAMDELAKQSPKQNSITFKVAGNGVILRAGYTPKNCMDDCFRGYKIDEIKRLK
ncbi:hypothetical protein BKI52_37280 [marine bacterium AO1-C]|nr:hypothetical protein BKI52_37280 [marine bacterium AO1-C]